MPEPRPRPGEHAKLPKRLIAEQPAQIAFWQPGNKQDAEPGENSNCARVAKAEAREPGGRL